MVYNTSTPWDVASSTLRSSIRQFHWPFCGSSWAHVVCVSHKRHALNGTDGHGVETGARWMCIPKNVGGMGTDGGRSVADSDAALIPIPAELSRNNPIRR